MKRTVLFSLRLYKRFLSPMLVSVFGQQCRYAPTCSEYMYEAIDRYGIIYGLWIGFKRILRCNPWSEGGHDPVPMR